MNRRAFVLSGVGLSFLCGATATNARAQEVSPSLIDSPPVCDIPTECRFSGGATSTALLNCGSYVYDREGRVLSAPSNCSKTTYQWTCLVCGKDWSEVH